MEYLWDRRGSLFIINPSKCSFLLIGRQIHIYFKYIVLASLCPGPIALHWLSPRPHCTIPVGGTGVRAQLLRKQAMAGGGGWGGVKDVLRSRNWMGQSQGPRGPPALGLALEPQPNLTSLPTTQPVVLSQMPPEKSVWLLGPGLLLVTPP